MVRRLLLAVVMSVVLVGCGSSDDGGAPVTGITTSDDDGYRGILLDEPYAVPDLTLLWTGATTPSDMAEDLEKILKADT